MEKKPKWSPLELQFSANSPPVLSVRPGVCPVWAVPTSATGVNTDTTVLTTLAHVPSRRDVSRSLRSVACTGLWWKDFSPRHAGGSMGIIEICGVSTCERLLPAPLCGCRQPIDIKILSKKMAGCFLAVFIRHWNRQAIKHSEINCRKVPGYTGLITLIQGLMCEKSNVWRVETPYSCNASIWHESPGMSPSWLHIKGQ